MHGRRICRTPMGFRRACCEQFWGLPYAIAALSTITGSPERNSLLLIFFPSYFIRAILADRLSNGWISAYFAVIDLDWLQRSFIGGSGPMFLAPCCSVPF